jgi:hypothetical protein
MPFSASTCLTYTGTTPLGSTLYVFSNVESPILYFTTIPLTAITGNNCPYIITGIPDGTTSIRLLDYDTNCCVDIPIQSNDLCITCDLDFTLLSASTNSLIVAGNLTGSCENITDYVVYWYGPNSSTEVGYVSGKGNSFNYTFPHPLTGTSSIFAQSGTYIPVIDKVKISGLTFSQTGGTGNYLANLDCFSPVTVDPLRCNNGNTVGDFSHVYQYSGATSGGVPLPLSASFELSSNTKFFSYTFEGFTVDDQLDLTLESVNYVVPIMLESVKVGSQVTGGQSYTSFPRRIPFSGVYNRILCLTGLTISSGDKIDIIITPNTTNNTTNWRLKMQCLSDWECDNCLDQSVSPYKIMSGSISTSIVSCTGMSLTYTITGCSASTITSTSAYKYLWLGNNTIESSMLSSNGINTRFSNVFRWVNTSCGINNQALATCFTPPNTNTITYEKTVSGGIGLITITCDTFSDLEFFKSRYDNQFALFSGSTDPTNINYYRMSNFVVPTPLGAVNCGDGTTFNSYGYHTPTAVVTTGGTGPWVMTLTMPTISAQTSFTTCEVNCQSFLNTIVNAINNASTGTSNNFSATTTKGSKANNPFLNRYALSINNLATTAQTFAASTYVKNSYVYQTIPWSGVSNTLIPSLSGLTCYPNAVCNNDFDCRRWYYYHQVILTNPLDNRDFEIYASPITNLQYSGAPGTTIYELALTYSGQTVTYANPNYCI